MLRMLAWDRIERSFSAQKKNEWAQEVVRAMLTLVARLKVDGRFDELEVSTTLTNLHLKRRGSSKGVSVGAKRLDRYFVSRLDVVSSFETDTATCGSDNVVAKILEYLDAPTANP